MKKNLFTLFLMALAIICFAGETVWVYECNGVRTAHDLSMIDSLSFVKPKYVSLLPSEKNLPSTGGRFSLDIYADGPWTATVSDPTALILSKTSGNGSETINVSAFANTEFKPYTETVTVELNDGTKAHLKVNVAVDHEYIDSDMPPFDSKIVEKQGDTFETKISSNTYWTAQSSDSWIHISPSSGRYNGTVKVTVDANTDAEDRYGTIQFKTMGGTVISRGVVCEGYKISVNPTIKEIKFEGGTIDLAVISSTEWIASSNKSWATLSVSSGSGNGTITVTVSENTSVKKDTAVVTLTIASGETASASIIRIGREKCSASDYPQVTIGTQTWMAENYRCSKYDTQSEAYKEGRYTIPTLDTEVCTPYYTDASDKSKWDRNSKNEYGVNLTDEQISKLGYLYNWAAAVGVADGEKQTTEFGGNRQGICPNGWHVPSRAEYNNLIGYIEMTDGKGADTAGKHLKTTSGWYDEDDPQTYPQGLDTYGFAALPAGFAHGSSVYEVGNSSFFCTATPDESINGATYILTLYSGVSYYHLYCEYNCFGRLVRCIKD